MKQLYLKLLVLPLLASLLISSSVCSQTEAFKPSIKFYPSVPLMYGLLFYTVNSSYYPGGGNKYYNTNFNIGIHVNADFNISKMFKMQAYAGYNRWTYANLFPVGILFKPKLTSNTNELYFSFGGGYTFGRNEDKVGLNSFSAESGGGSANIQAGIEKYWLFKNSKSLSINFMLSLQFIKNNYYSYSNGLGSSSKINDQIAYKFIGLNIGYHFY